MYVDLVVIETTIFFVARKVLLFIPGSDFPAFYSVSLTVPHFCLHVGM